MEKPSSVDAFKEVTNALNPVEKRFPHEAKIIWAYIGALTQLLNEKHAEIKRLTKEHNGKAE